MAKKQILDLNGLTELVNEMQDYITNRKVLPFKTTAEFPGIGKFDTIYIDITHNTIYRWDDDNSKYYRLAFDPNDTYILNCGSSKGGK